MDKTISRKHRQALLGVLRGSLLFLVVSAMKKRQGIVAVTGMHEYSVSSRSGTSSKHFAARYVDE